MKANKSNNNTYDKNIWIDSFMKKSDTECKHPIKCTRESYDHACYSIVYPEYAHLISRR